ncbi:MAG: PAS domain S-box protein [Desertifilum sp.]|nr:PAS domain S-box protein [Desertifilum sp.]
MLSFGPAARPACELQGGIISSPHFQHPETLLSQLPGLVYQGYFHPEGYIEFTYLSAGCKTLLGLEAAELIANPHLLTERLPPDRRQSFIKTLQAAQQQPQFWEWEGCFVTSEGKVKWLTFCAIPEAQPSGKVLWQGWMADITYTMQLELAVQRSKTRFAQLVANVPAVIYQYRQGADRSDTLTYISPYIRDLLGINPDSLLQGQDPFRRFVHPEDFDSWQNAIAHSATTLSQLHWEGRLIDTSGEIKWVNTTSRPKQQVNGDILWDGVLIDISDRKHAEIALSNSEQKYRSLYDSMNEGVMLCEMLYDLAGNPTDYRILEVNPAYEDIIGMKREQAVGTYASQLEGIGEIAYLEEFARVAQTGEAIAFEAYSEALDKDFRICAFATAPHQFAILFEDITQRKLTEVQLEQTVKQRTQQLQDTIAQLKSEIQVREQVEGALRQSQTQLANLLESITDGFFAVNREGQFTYLNHSGEQILHLSQTEVLGQNLWEVFPEWRGSQLEGAIAEAIATGKLATFEICTLAERQWLEVRIYPSGEGLSIFFHDITQQKHAQAAIHQAQEHFQKLAENVPGMLYQFVLTPDGNTKFSFVSAGSQEVYELTPQQIYENGQLLLDAVDPEDRETFVQAVALSQQNLSPWRWEGRIWTPSGKMKWISGASRPEKTSEGEIFWDGIVTDITPNKLAEAELLKQHQRSQLLAEITVKIRQSLQIEEILQTTVTEVLRILNCDRVLIYQLLPDGGGVVTSEATSGDCQSILGETITDPCFHNRYLEAYRQGRVRAIADLDNCDVQPCHVELLKKFQVKANLVVPILQREDLWGLLIAHQCTTTRDWTAFELELLQQLANQVGIALAQAQLLEQYMKTSQQLAKQNIILEQALVSLQNTQTQLVQSEKMASLGQLVAGVAHEINNPVSFIYGNLSHARQYFHDLLDLLHLYQRHYPEPVAEIADTIEELDLDFITADLQNLLKSMNVGTKRIREIVESLRNFSRLDEAECKAVNLHEGIDNTLLILQHRLRANSERSDITIHKDYAALPPIRCYAGHLNQVFMNLLANAIDALEEKLRSTHATFEPTITIQTSVLDSVPSAVAIRISDNGIGMEPETQQRLFDPFFTTKPIGRGTGLGLSISHSIVVERHGGQITVQSERGRGTTFEIVLPWDEN